MKSSIKILVSACLLGGFLASCGLGKMVTRYPEVNIKLDNVDLENKGGKVEYKVTGVVPPKYMKKKATMTFTPTVDYMGQKITLSPIELQGQTAKAKGTIIPFKTGGKFSSTGTFDFKEGYEDANFVVGGKADMKKASHTFDDRVLCEGIVNSASLININPELGDKAGNGTTLIYGEHGYKTEYLTGSSVLYFALNSSNLDMGLKLNRSAEARKAVADFYNFMKEGRTIDKIVIAGWASPEGEESLNQGLSEKRATEGKKWFEKEFDKYLRQYAKANKIKYKDLQKPELVFEVTSLGEDWNGFEKDLEASNIAEKMQILNVVRSQSTPAAKEQKIREMTDIYSEIADMILPPLRRVEVSMVCKKNNFTHEQIAEFAKTNPDTLSVNERLFAASMEKNLEAKKAIYAAIIDEAIAENDWRSYNNLAILQINDYILNGDASHLTAGKKNLEKAAAISPNNGIILNNTAIAQFLSGDVEAAMQNFATAEKAALYPVEQGYNLAMNQIISGNYESAAKEMSNKKCDYNMALVQMLQKDYDAALNTLNCVTQKDAKTYYLQAVLAARMKNENGVYSNLKSCVNLDAAYKAKAKKDAEFKQYKRSADFKAIVE